MTFDGVIPTGVWPPEDDPTKGGDLSEVIVRFNKLTQQLEESLTILSRLDRRDKLRHKRPKLRKSPHIQANGRDSIPDAFMRII